MVTRSCQALIFLQTGSLNLSGNFLVVKRSWERGKIPRQVQQNTIRIFLNSASLGIIGGGGKG